MTRSRSGQASRATTRQVTIQDVARAAAVSRQTVSNVLNGSGRVGDAARARVLEAVAALGYLLSAGRPGRRPDAVVTSSDRLAGVTYSVASELRLRIGRDLAVTGRPSACRCPAASSASSAGPAWRW